MRSNFLRRGWTIVLCNRELKIGHRMKARCLSPVLPGFYNHKQPAELLWWLTVLFSCLSACFREGLVFLVWSLECVCMKGRQRKTPIYNFTRGPRNLLGLHVQGRMAACCQWPPKHPCPFDLCCQAGFCVPGLSWHSHTTSHSGVHSFNTVPPLLLGCFHRFLHLPSPAWEPRDQAQNREEFGGGRSRSDNKKNHHSTLISRACEL